MFCHLVTRRRRVIGVPRTVLNLLSRPELAGTGHALSIAGHAPTRSQARPLQDGGARTWAVQGGVDSPDVESKSGSGPHATGSGNSTRRSQSYHNCHRDAEGASSSRA